MAKKQYNRVMSGGLWKSDGDNPEIVLSGNVQMASEIERLKKAGEKEPYSKAERYSATVFKNADATGKQPEFNLVISEVRGEDDGLPF
jgi:hypothetical protein